MAATGAADHRLLKSQVLRATQPETDTGLDREYVPPKNKQQVAIAKWIEQHVGPLPEILQWAAGAHDFPYLENWQQDAGSQECGLHAFAFLRAFMQCPPSALNACVVHDVGRRDDGVDIGQDAAVPGAFPGAFTEAYPPLETITPALRWFLAEALYAKVHECGRLGDPGNEAALRSWNAVWQLIQRCKRLEGHLPTMEHLRRAASEEKRAAQAKAQERGAERPAASKDVPSARPGSTSSHPEPWLLALTKPTLALCRRNS